MNLPELLQKLPGATKTATGWQARCPAHEDKTPSLSISEGREGILLKCFAGCSFESITAALGINPSDLFFKSNGSQPAREIVATYDYTDESGKLLFQVVRFEPKDFRQRRPDATAKDGWTWNTKGVNRVLFRLPEILGAVAEGRPVYVCEGEKDVLAMVDRGFAATTTPGGAGKWQDGFTETLGFADVVIIADKDEPGRQHARTVAAAVEGVAKSVRVLDLPDVDGKPVKDAADYFAAGGQPADLDELAQAAPPWTEKDSSVPGVSIEASEHASTSTSISFSAGLSFDVANDPNTLLGVYKSRTTRYLCKGKGMWIVAPSGIGKSVLLYQAACLFTLGRPLFGIAPVKPLRVLIFQAENDLGDMAEMIQGAAAALGIDGMSDEVDILDENLKVVTECQCTGLQFCKRLAREITQHRADLALVDPLLSFAGIDVSRQDQCTTFLRGWLNPVLADTGAGLISTHHTGKPKSMKDLRGMTAVDYAYQGLGSSELVNWARAVTVIMSHGDCYELKLLKRGTRAGATHPNGEPTTSVWMRHAVDKLWWNQCDPPTESEPEKAAPGGRPSKVDAVLTIGLGLLIDTLSEPIGKTELAQRIEERAAEAKLDASGSTCKRVIERLVKNGAIRKQNGLYVKS